MLGPVSLKFRFSHRQTDTHTRIAGTVFANFIVTNIRAHAGAGCVHVSDFCLARVLAKHQHWSSPKNLRQTQANDFLEMIGHNILQRVVTSVSPGTAKIGRWLVRLALGARQSDHVRVWQEESVGGAIGWIDGAGLMG